MALATLSNTDMKGLATSIVSERITRAFPPVKYLELMLTADCNLRCSYCWVRGKRPDHMSLDVVRRSIDFLAHVSKRMADVGILFFGGEPLLRMAAIREAVQYAGELFSALGKRVSFDMTTNGTLLDETTCRYLAEGGVKYLLSLDGDREHHDQYRRTRGGCGSFDMILSNFGTMKQHQPWQGARVTVAPKLAPYLAENIRALFKRGINQFIIGPAHGAGWTDEQIQQFEHSMYRVFDYYLEQKTAGRHIRLLLYEQGTLEQMATKYCGVWGCGAGRGRLCVTPDGSLYGCSKMATISGVGNGLLRLGDVWKGFTDWEARKLLNDSSSRRRHRCRSCSLASRCTGGCPATNYNETGNIFESGSEACAFARVYDRIGLHAKRRLEALGIWNQQDREGTSLANGTGNRGSGPDRRRCVTGRAEQG